MMSPKGSGFEYYYSCLYRLPGIKVGVGGGERIDTGWPTINYHMGTTGGDRVDGWMDIWLNELPNIPTSSSKVWVCVCVGIKLSLYHSWAYRNRMRTRTLN